jgi:hypothetical protein
VSGASAPRTRCTAADLAENRQGRLSFAQAEAIAAILGGVPEPFERTPERGSCLLPILMLGLPILAMGVVPFLLRVLWDETSMRALFSGVVAALVVFVAGLGIHTAGASRRRSRWQQEVVRIRTLLSMEPKAGHVACEAGEVVWARDHYACRVGARELVMPSPAAWRVDLRPGKHRVYFLTESGLVLGVEPIADFEAEREPALVAALAEACSFDAAWLPALRAGGAPPGAVRQLVKNILVAVACILGIFQGLAALLVLATDKGPIWPLSLLFAACSFLLLAPMSPAMIGQVQAARAGRFRAAEGEARVTPDTRDDDVDRAHLAIGDLRLDVPGPQGRVFARGIVYRAYYLKDPVTLIAAEPISTVAEPDAPALDAPG